MFIRSKTISNKNYAYLVRTKWDKRSKKVKQKVSKYLGPIKKLDKIKDIGFFEYYNFDKNKYIDSVKIKELVRDLTEHELFKHGFIRLSKYRMSNGVFEINLEKLDNIFEMNEGYMNQYTLKELEKYNKILGEVESKIPYKFASLFVNAGLNVDPDLFIELYQKFFSNSISMEEDKLENIEY